MTQEPLPASGVGERGEPFPFTNARSAHRGGRDGEDESLHEVRTRCGEVLRDEAAHADSDDVRRPEVMFEHVRVRSGEPRCARPFGELPRPAEHDDAPRGLR